MLKEIKETLRDIKESCADIRANAGKEGCPLKQLQDRAKLNNEVLKNVANTRRV